MIIDLNFLTENYYNKILTFFSNKTKNYSEAQDLTHDFFIYLNEMNLNNKNIINLNTYIFTCANNFFKKSQSKIKFYDMSDDFDIKTTVNIDSIFINDLSLKLNKKDKNFLDVILTTNSLKIKDLASVCNLSERQIKTKMKKLKTNLVLNM
jgi:hypothetical protein